jgi:hypothetical protein
MVYLVTGAVATVCAAGTRGCRDAPGPGGIQGQSVQENLHEPSRKCQVRATFRKITQEKKVRESKFKLGQLRPYLERESQMEQVIACISLREEEVTGVRK